MKVYKLTDADGYTRRGESGETKWEIGKTERATGAGKNLCSKDVLHAYKSAELAVLFNPIHAALEHPRLFVGEAPEVVADDTLKLGVKELTLVEEIPLPEISVDAKVNFAITVALSVFNDKEFKAWADNWLSGKDRSADAAADAAYAAYADAADAAYAAYADAAYAAYAAAHAAAHAADAAAHAAARAARAAARAAKINLDFQAVILAAIEQESKR